ncbi:MAG TPA: hypothetical protein VF179_09245 [Thermoanaerobaculia bacterium]|nr:hypothetical protein [Thermoanaerobaculia bacterium]
MRGWAVVAACLAVVCGLTVWAAQTTARPAAPWPVDGGAADSARLVIE